MESLLKESGHQNATILYADITGFDELTNSLEPKKIAELINDCFAIINPLVALYKGNVEKWSGDGIVAVFGLSDFNKKTPLQAVSAAVDMQNKIAEYNSDKNLPVDVNIKIGIYTGQVFIGKIGSDKNAHETVMGKTVSIASRICDIAENGQVLAGKETFEIIKDKFECFVLEPVPIKGYKKPLPVFEVKGRKRVPLNIGTKQNRIINSAMVGREKEYRQFEKQVMQLINGRGSVVNIVGKAGIGKSRLLAEIKHNDILGKVVIFEGRALSNGHNLSFHPIIQIIKSWTGIKEEDTSTESLRKLESNIKRIYSEAFDEIFPFIATMMGYRLKGKAKDRIKGIEGEALENLILKNMRDLLSRAASIRPVVIVIEDAHWCDISSIIFIESLFKLVQKQRILFVNVFRPGYKQTGERIQKFLNENLPDRYTEVKVDPLTGQESGELIANLLKKVNLPEEINLLIIERAAGNPFFIEEVIRSFIDEGLIIIENKRFILTDKIKFANIPESIDNVILFRIDRLDDKTKNLLRTASVIGRNFYYKVLEEAAQTIEEVDNKLEYLKDVQLINERKQKDEVEFLFKHALAQQTTYDSIMEKTRKDLHLKIAGSIEKVFAGRINEFYGMLAHHYSKAGQQEKTEEYLIKAGDESMKSGASSEAVFFIKKGLEIYHQNKLTPDPQEVVNIEEKLAFAYFASGQFLEAIEYFDKVIAFYDKPFPKSNIRNIFDLVINIIIKLKIIYTYKHSGRDAEKETRRIFKIIESNSHALTTIDTKKLFFVSMNGYRFIKRKNWGSHDASMMVMNGTMLFYTGILFKLGIKSTEFAMKFIDEKDTLVWLRSKFNRSMYLYFAGKKDEDLEEDKVYQLALQTGEIWKVATFYVYNGYNALEAGNEKRLSHLLKRLRSISEAFDSDFPIIQYHRLKIALYIKFRKMDEALSVTKESLKFANKTQYKMQLFLSYCHCSMAATILKKYNESSHYLLEAEKLLKDFNIRYCHCQFLIAKSYLEIDGLKEKPTRRTSAKLALKTTNNLIKNAQKVRKNLTESYRLRALVCQQLNKPGKALINYKKSIGAALSFGGDLELSRTYFEAGKFLQDMKNKKTRVNGLNATECLLKAKSLFEEMNLEWDLKEYEKYMEGI